MADKETVPEHIKKFKDLRGKYKKLVDTLNVEHSAAYLKGAETITEGGQVNYDLLDKEENQQKFADAMAGHYLKKLEKYGKPGNAMESDMLMKAFTGATQTQLYDLVKKHGKEYTLDTHERIKSRFIRNVSEIAEPATYGHLRDEHVEEYVKHMGLEGIVDASKMTVHDLVQVHDLYDEHGALTPKLIKTQYTKTGQGSLLFLKKEKEKKKEYDKAA